MWKSYTWAIEFPFARSLGVFQGMLDQTHIRWKSHFFSRALYIRKTKPFLDICKHIMNSWDRFLFKTKHRSVENGRRIHFSRKECEGISTGTFTETGILGMFDCFCFNNIGIVLLSLVKVVEKMFVCYRVAQFAEIWWTTLISATVFENDFPERIGARKNSKTWWLVW